MVFPVVYVWWWELDPRGWVLLFKTELWKWKTLIVERLCRVLWTKQIKPVILIKLNLEYSFKELMLKRSLISSCCRCQSSVRLKDPFDSSRTRPHPLGLKNTGVSHSFQYTKSEKSKEVVSSTEFLSNLKGTATMNKPTYWKRLHRPGQIEDRRRR